MMKSKKQKTKYVSLLTGLFAIIVQVTNASCFGSVQILGLSFILEVVVIVFYEKSKN